MKLERSRSTRDVQVQLQAIVTYRLNQASKQNNALLNLQLYIYIYA